jgi:hypothetical protein
MFSCIYIKYSVKLDEYLSLLGLISGGRLAGSNVGPNLGQSVFDYIEKQNARSPLFCNFMYTPDTDHPVRFFFFSLQFVPGEQKMCG